MKKLILLFFIMIMPFISYGDNSTNDELIIIIINKNDLHKVKEVTYIYETYDYSFQDEVKEIQYKDIINKEKEKKWISELKISVGVGGTYGVINNEFDLGPTVSIGYEFTF